MFDVSLNRFRVSLSMFLVRLNRFRISVIVCLAESSGYESRSVCLCVCVCVCVCGYVAACGYMVCVSLYSWLIVYVFVAVCS